MATSIFANIAENEKLSLLETKRTAKNVANKLLKKPIQI